LELIKNRTQLFACLLIIVLGTIIYSNSFYGEFHFDDSMHIVQQNKLNDLSSYSRFSSWTRINDRPLAYFTLSINRSLNETNVFGYHVFNLMVHLLTSVMVFFFTLLIISREIVKPIQIKGKEKLIALFVALIFLCHPIQTQAVSYIIQRMTSLAALFYIASCFFYFRARLSQVGGDLNLKFILYYLFMVVTAIAAILSKQIAITLPLTYLIIEFFFIKNKQGKRFNKFLLTGVVIISISFIVVVIGGLLPQETESISRFDYFLTQLRVIVKYVQLLVFPISQNLDYDFIISKSIFGIDELISGAIVISLLGSIFVLYRKYPLISFGLAWFFITLLVESSIIPIRDVIFEHRLYLPMFGFAIVIAIFLLEVLNKIKLTQLIIVFSVIVSVYSYLTITRNTVWKTNLSLWYDVVQKSPAKARPHINLGVAYFQLLKPLAAIEQFNIAVKLEPNNNQIYYDRAEAYLLLNQTEEAIQDLTQSISIHNKFVKAYVTRARAKLRLNDFNAAVIDYSKAIELQPELASAWFGRGKIYLFNGDLEKALNDLNKAIDLYPGFAAALNNRALVMLYLGKENEALSDLNQAINLEPKLISSYNDIAKTCYAKGRFDFSIIYLISSLQHNDQDSAMLKLRGICYLKQNKFKKAYSDFLRADAYGAQIDEALLEKCKQSLNIQKPL
jgi:tetratricopeptide (TPR) repeat protein